MKFIGITQRVDFISTCYEEKRDSLDLRWMFLLNRCGLIPIPLPNHLEIARKIVQEIPCSGFIFSGGNDLAAYRGDAPERDMLERFLLEFAINRKLPLLGVCRGMQVIQDYFGIPMQPVENHAGKKHLIAMGGQKSEVNSFHRWGSCFSVPELESIAIAPDGVIESIKHKHLPIYGIMWHPERNSPFDEIDINLIRSLFYPL